MENNFNMGEISNEDIYYFAQHLYRKSTIKDNGDYEEHTPHLSHIMTELIKITGLDEDASSKIRNKNEFELSRKIIQVYFETDEGKKDIEYLMKSQGHHTMSSMIDLGLLSIFAIISLKNLIEIEVDNKGKSGKIRWSVRIGGNKNDPGLYKLSQNIITQWLKNIAGEK